jgi:hypothetical protein
MIYNQADHYEKDEGLTESLRPLDDPYGTDGSSRVLEGRSSIIGCHFLDP